MSRSEEDARKFKNTPHHFVHDGTFIVELTDQADRSIAPLNGCTIRGNAASIDGQIVNPASRFPDAPITIMGRTKTWEWPRNHVKFVLHSDGKFLWVNHALIPEEGVNARETPCQQAMKALSGIVDEFFALPGYEQNASQLHFKNQFYGALKMLPCLPIGPDEWELLRQCVTHNAGRLYADKTEVGKTLKWITESEK